MSDRYERKTNIPKEYDKVLYVYDRICPKQFKKRQINRTYGPEYSRRDVHVNQNRVYGKAFAESQRRRAEAYAKASGANRANVKNSSCRGSPSYSYRPGKAGGGEAVRERPLKLLIDGIINLFESIEERGRADERIAKQRAIARKKLSEYRHAIITAIILVLISVVFLTFVYNTFFVIKNVSAEGSEIYSSDEIAASAGFNLGDTLYSFRSSDAEDEITFRCPYIKTADVRRSIPNSVSINVEDDTAVYIAKIWDEYLVISAGLRVLDSLDEEEECDLIELVLPPVNYSVAGRVVEFEDQRDERFIRSILLEISESSLGTSGMVDKIDLSNEYDITIQSCGKYIMKLGDESDCDLKLRMAYKTVTDEQFDSSMPAKIDLSEVGEASVRYDLQLTFE